ncbi:hypothetical protein HYU92_05260 [Candidatus Curtissbacteria bacterium]|nr:hypothetical protein [Candidatus Curtissbacteria bacterium]
MRLVSIVLTNPKILAVSILLAFSLTGTLAMTVMDMDHEGSMSNCILMVQEKEQSCQMTITQHIASWQQMFAAVSSANILSLVLVLIPLGLGLSFLKRVMLDPPELQLYKRYVKENSSLKLFDYLLLAFSRGILHSKIYA